MSPSWEIDMPKIVCSCGEWLRFSEIPCPIEWRIISDVEFDKFTGMVNTEDIYLAMTGMLLCPTCGNLWVFWDGYDEAPQEYIPRKESSEDS